MRVHFATTFEQCKAIFRGGWQDLHTYHGMHGVWFVDRPRPRPILNLAKEHDGPVLLCLDVPEDVFLCHEWPWVIEARASLIPAEVLNGIGKPEVWDHVYSLHPRREVGRFVPDDERDAVAFLEGIGWLVPLRARGKPTG